MFEDNRKEINKVMNEIKYDIKLEDNNKIDIENYLPEKINDNIRKYLNYPEIKIEYVDEYTLGHNILGRAFPLENRIQIRYDLYGDLREKVKEHEKIHIKHPDWSEYKVRVESDTLHI